MRVLVTGGRDFTDQAMVRLALRGYPADAVLVHGAARGADSLAARQWTAWGRPVEAHPADWKQHGKGAGPIRNQQMLDSGVDVLVAFPGGKGTLDMVQRAKRAGVPIVYAVQLRPYVADGGLTVG